MRPYGLLLCSTVVKIFVSCSIIMHFCKTYILAISSSGHVHLDYPSIWIFRNIYQKKKIKIFSIHKFQFLSYLNLNNAYLLVKNWGLIIVYLDGVRVQEYPRRLSVYLSVYLSMVDISGFCLLVRYVNGVISIPGVVC